MGSLAGCFKRLGIDGPEAAYIRSIAKAYKDDGVPGMEANQRAVQELIRDMEAERASVMRQIRQSSALRTAADQIEGKKAEEKIEQTDQGTALFSRAMDDERPPSASPGRPAQETLDKISRLNATMQASEGVSNAFRLSRNADQGVIDAYKAAFGVDVVPIAPTSERAAGYNGVHYQGTLFVNTDANAGFVQVAGHELLHQLRRDQPELYDWFADHASRYLTGGALRHYGARLREAGADLRTTDIREELLADVTGDALADPAFLRQLADDNPSRFERFLRTVLDWMREVVSNLSKADLGSSHYVTDLHAMRHYLREVLTAYRADGPTGIEAVARPEFSRAPGRTDPAPPFYSHMRRVIEQKMPARANFEQVKNIVSSSNGVKPDELKWSGLDDFLKTKEYFTKPEVLDFINQSEVQVKEVEKLSEDATEARFHALQELASARNAAEEAELRSMVLNRGRRNETKFSSYQLPGGKDYRELLLTLPVAKRALTGWRAERFGESTGADYEGWNVRADMPNGKVFRSEIGIEDAATAEEAIAMAKEAAASHELTDSGEAFRSSHFSEPNILAHVRFNDRMVDGQKVLFLEEVQSDWHQQGRSKGYKVSPERKAELEKRRLELEAFGRDATVEQKQQWADVMNELQPDNTSRVPDAPFKKTWHELALKRMLRYAAEHGYDRIAWTTGEQQAERYDLSKQVQAVHVDPIPGGKSVSIEVTTKEGARQHLGEFEREKLAEVVGKDLADRINKEAIEPDVEKNYSGLDLKVGGSGMKGFYDKIVPDYLNKYGKKWGATVQPLKVGTSVQADMYVSNERNGYVVRRADTDREVAFFNDKSKADDFSSGKGFESHSLPITDAMKESVMLEGQPLFSRTMPVTQPTTPPSRHKFVSHLTSAQQAALERIHGTPTTWRDKLDSFKTTWKREVVQGLFDQYAPILDYSKKGYMLSRMSKAGDGTLEALMLYGKPYVDADGAYRVDYKQETGLQGFSKVLSALQGEQDRFLEWVAAKRADRLKGLGLENLYSEEDIATLKTLNHGNMPDGTRREVAYLKALKELNDWNDAMLKIGVDSGLINPDTQETFKDVPYVPFYRLQEEGVTPGFGVKPGLVNQYAWKKLKGGTAHLNDDLLANLLQNWSHIITASAKNRAAKETLTAAEAAGVAEMVPNGTTGKNLVHYMGEREVTIPKGQEYEEKGETKVSDGTHKMLVHGPITYSVEDPLLLDAVAALHYAGLGDIGKPFTAMKRALSFAVTVNPAYKIRNLIRDSIQAIGTSELSYNPLKNVSAGAKATGKLSDTRAQMLAGGGMIRFGSMLDGNNADRTRRLIESGVDPDLILGDAGAMERFWKTKIRPAFDAYQEFGDRTEQMNRAALYEQLLKKGMSHQEATFWARDLMDFSMGGKWGAVRILTQVVPFMNARLQGLYKIGRATKADYKKMATTLGAVALASIGLMLAYGDDDDWKKREDWDRDNFWWFKVGGLAVRIPKPFEIGAMGTIAERSVEYLVSDEMTGKRFGERLSATVFNQLSMNPTPQLIKPLMDLYANKDAFTGRPIETMGMEKVRKQDRYAERTSEVAKFLGSLGLPDPAQLAMGRWDTLSPVQVDSLVKGYFSWLGSSATTVLDYGIRPFVDRGERPNMQLRNVFLAGNFVETLPSGSSRYLSELYSQADEIEEAYGSYRAALKRGDTEGAKEILSSEREKIAQYKRIEKVKREESAMSTRMKLIEASTRLTGAEKREQLDALKERRHRLARRVSEMQRSAP